MGYHMTGNTTVQQLLKLAQPNANARRTACALTLCGLAAFAGPAAAQTGYVGILGAGAVVQHVKKNINELSKSGFNEVIIWSVEVSSTGDLNLDGGFPLTSAGAKLLSRHKSLKLLVTAVAHDGSGPKVTLSRTITVHEPPLPHRKRR